MSTLSCKSTGRESNPPEWKWNVAWERATRILDQAERGELGLTLSLKETDRIVGKLDRIANRLVVSILLAALIVGMALLIPLVAEGGRGFVFWLVVAGFAAASFMGLGLLYSIWQAERRGR